jgi:molybdopterin synthase catalytic subunit
MPKHHVVISDKKLDLLEAHEFVTAPEFGAITSFVGIVRNNNEGRKAEAVTYDVHESLAIKSLDGLCAEGIVMAKGEARVYIAHAKGRLNVGEASVIIAVATPHRKLAFDVCEFMIDRMKESVPIWKNEHYIEGDAAWLDGKPLSAPKDNCCGGCGSV